MVTRDRISEEERRKRLPEVWGRLKKQYPERLGDIEQPFDENFRLTAEAAEAYRDVSKNWISPATPSRPVPTPTVRPQIRQQQDLPVQPAPPLPPPSEPNLFERALGYATAPIEYVTAPIEAFHQRVMIPAVSSRTKFSPIQWEEGRPKLTFDAFRKPGGGFDPAALIDFASGPVGMTQAVVREALDMPTESAGTIRAQRIEAEVKRREATTGKPVSAQERRQIGEEIYKLPPYVRGLTEELPYFALPSARAVRSGMQVLRGGLKESRRLGRATPVATGAIRAGEHALKPIEILEEVPRAIFGGTARGVGRLLGRGTAEGVESTANVGITTATAGSPARAEIKNILNRIPESAPTKYERASKRGKKDIDKAFKESEKRMKKLLEGSEEPSLEDLEFINRASGRSQRLGDPRMRGWSPNEELADLVKRARNESEELVSLTKQITTETAKEVINANILPDRMRSAAEWLAGLPGMEKVVQRVFTPAALAGKKGYAALKEGYGYRLIQQLQDGRASVRLNRFGEKIFDVDNAGRVLLRDGTRKAFSDVAERPTDYRNLLTEEQFKWIGDAHEYIDELARNYQLVSGEQLIWKRVPGPDQKIREHYFPRIVKGVLDKDHLMVEGKVGTRARSAKERLHDTMEEGIDKNVNYEADPFKVLEFYSKSVSKMTRDTIFEKRLLSQKLAALRGQKKAIKRIQEKEGVLVAPSWAVRGRGRNWEDLLVSPEVNRQLSQPLGTRRTGLLRAAEMAAAVPKLIVTGLMDTGQFMIQGYALLARSPDSWATAVSMSIREMFKPGTFRKYMEGPLKSKVESAGSRGMDVSAISEYFLEASGVVGRLPVVGKMAGVFQRGFQAYMGVGRVLIYDAMEESIRLSASRGAINPRTGARYTAHEIEQELLKAARIADSLLGGTSTKGLGVSATQRQIENAFLFFAPRYTRSAFGVISHAVGYKVTKPTLTAIESRRILGRMLYGGALIVAGGTGLSGIAQNKKSGEIWEDIRKSVNPTEGMRFMSVKVGDQYYGVGGGYRALLGFLGNSAPVVGKWDRTIDDPDWNNRIFRNPVAKYIRSKTPMTTGTVVDWIDGQDFIGGEFTQEAFTEDPGKLASYLMKRTTPFPIQAFVEASSSGLPVATSAFAAEFVGGRAVPATATEKMQEVGREFMKETGVKGTFNDILNSPALQGGYKIPTTGPLAESADQLRESPAEYWQLPRRIRTEMEADPEFEAAKERKDASTEEYNPGLADYYRTEEIAKTALFDTLTELEARSRSLNAEQPMKLYKSVLKTQNILGKYHEGRQRRRDAAKSEGLLSKDYDPDGPFRRAEDIYNSLLYVDDEETFNKAFPGQKRIPLEDEVTGEFNWDERERRMQFLVDTYGEGFVRDMKEAVLRDLPDFERKRREAGEYIGNSGYWNVDKFLASQYGVEAELKEYRRLQDTNEIEAKAFLNGRDTLRKRVIGGVTDARKMLRVRNPDLDAVLIHYGYVSGPVRYGRWSDRLRKMGL